MSAPAGGAPRSSSPGDAFVDLTVDHGARRWTGVRAAPGRLLPERRRRARPARGADRAAGPGVRRRVRRGWCVGTSPARPWSTRSWSRAPTRPGSGSPTSSVASPRYSFYNAGTADRGLRPEHLAGLALPAGRRAARRLGRPRVRAAGRHADRAGPRGVRPAADHARPERASLGHRRPRSLPRTAGRTGSALSDVVKVSDEDLAWLHPGEPVETVARRWLASGRRRWCWSPPGAAGAWATTASSTMRVPSPGPWRSSTRSGPGTRSWRRRSRSCGGPGAWTRTGVASLEAGDLEALLTFAVRVAADTCTRSGAEPPRWSVAAGVR